MTQFTARVLDTSVLYNLVFILFPIYIFSSLGRRSSTSFRDIIYLRHIVTFTKVALQAT